MIEKLKQKNSLILALVGMAIVVFGIGIYLNSAIEENLEQYTLQKNKIEKYKTLNERYSSRSIEESKKKIYEFLDLFDIEYTTSKNQNGIAMVQFELKKTQIDKILGYILKSDVEIKQLHIEKIDQYKVKIDVSI